MENKSVHLEKRADSEGLDALRDRIAKLGIAAALIALGFFAVAFGHWA